VSNYSLREVVRECFNGDRERNCSLCPAYHGTPRREITCCFGGEEYNPADKECRDCLHEESCSEESAIPQPIPASRYARTSYSSGRRSVVPKRGSQGLPIVGQGAPTIQPQKTAAQPLVVQPEMTFIQQVGLHAVWGAVEGTLGMLLNFFQNRRPD
jgi:hypothetical protein